MRAAGLGAIRVKEYMALELFTYVAGAMTLGVVVATTGGFGGTFGGMIGKPNEEIVVEPEEEPVPRVAPVPVPRPVQEPLPARFRHVLSVRTAETWRA